MAPMGLRTILRWALYPLVYAAVTPALFVASLASFGIFEMRPSGTIEVTGHALGLLLVITLALVLLGIGLVRLERLRPPTIRDHLRHRALLYRRIAVTYDGRYCC